MEGTDRTSSGPDGKYKAEDDQSMGNADHPIEHGTPNTTQDNIPARMEEPEAPVVNQGLKRRAEHEDEQDPHRQKRSRTTNGIDTDLNVQESHAASHLSKLGAAQDALQQLAKVPDILNHVASTTKGLLPEMQALVPIAQLKQQNINFLEQMEGKLIKVGTSYRINEQTWEPEVTDSYRHHEVLQQEGFIPKHDATNHGCVREGNVAAALHETGLRNEHYKLKDGAIEVHGERFRNDFAREVLTELGMEDGQHFKMQNGKLILTDNVTLKPSPSVEHAATLDRLFFDVVKFLREGASGIPVELSEILTSTIQEKPSHNTTAKDQMLSSLKAFFGRVDDAMEPLLDAAIDTAKCLQGVFGGITITIRADDFEVLKARLSVLCDTPVTTAMLKPTFSQDGLIELGGTICARVLTSLERRMSYLFVGCLSLDRLFVAKHRLTEAETDPDQLSQPPVWFARKKTLRLWYRFTRLLETAAKSALISDAQWDQAELDIALRYNAKSLSNYLLYHLLDDPSYLGDLPREEVIHTIAAGLGQSVMQLDNDRVALLRGG